ncbi:NUDIX hydrolase [Negativibacillus massiliensis]|uniref:NUDIX hydrolase n=1 Tax=Negativibacillus massiliensis TaxID=1871035 RepID=UPI003AF22905
MRAPFQILAIPYRFVNQVPVYCVFYRTDSGEWQFIAGGGEDNETPLQAASREILEEGGVLANRMMELKSMCYIPTNIFPKMHLYNWSEDTYVVPEYAFGFECTEEIKLSHEHTECMWLSYQDAYEKLRWDSNRTALYELNCRLKKR